MAGSLGIKEIVLLIVLFVVIFGARRLPELGRSLGRGMREFRDGIAGNGENGLDARALSRRQRPRP